LAIKTKLLSAGHLEPEEQVHYRDEDDPRPLIHRRRLALDREQVGGRLPNGGGDGAAIIAVPASNTRLPGPSIQV
jgi:hypothetical protein